MDDLCVFQIYYDSLSKTYLNKKCKPLYNLHGSLYFENAPIAKILESGFFKIKCLLDANYRIGFLSYKYEHKNFPIKFEQITNASYDLFVMPGCMVLQDVLEVSNLYHGDQFTEMFKRICKLSGIEAENFNLQVGIYQNGVIAPVHIWKRYHLEYLKPMMDFMKNKASEYPDVLQWLESDSTYKGGLSSEKLKSLTGFGHYTQHTFVLERLWSLFYHNNNLTINL